MKRLCLLCVILLLGACGNNRYAKAENAFDAGREFIDGCLKGDFDKAEFYMLKNDTNEQQLNSLKNAYRNKPGDEKRQYSDASINILEEEIVNNTTHIINYKNSFDNIPHKIKVVQRNGEWLVDVAYTFSGNL